MRAAPIAVGVYRGIRGDDRDRAFRGERRFDSSPVCSAMTRPPGMAALSFCYQPRLETSCAGPSPVCQKT
jgi:hypothetical protein